MRKHIKGMVLIGLLALLMVVALPAMAEVVEPPASVAGMIDLTGISVTLLTVIGSIIVLRVKPWVMAWLQANATASQQKALNIAARTVVFAAEQIFRNEASSGNKKMIYVKSKLREKGFDVDIDAIEAAVKEMHLEEVLGLEMAPEVEIEGETEPPDNPVNPDR